jgi:hypothetical protein
MSTTIVVHDMDAARAERHGDAVHVSFFTGTGDQCTIVATTVKQADTGAKAWFAATVLLADDAQATPPPPLNLEGGAS